MHRVKEYKITHNVHMYTYVCTCMYTYLYVCLTWCPDEDNAVIWRSLELVFCQHEKDSQGAARTIA